MKTRKKKTALRAPISPTDVYPTRYHAFDHGGVWALFKPVRGAYRLAREDGDYAPLTRLGATQTNPGELAVLYDKRGGMEWAALKWSYAEIFGTFTGSDFVAHCQGTDRDGKSVATTLRATTLRAAMVAAEHWIAGEES